jgi:amidase
VQRISRRHLIGIDSAGLPAAAVVRPGETLWVETGRGSEAPFLTGPIEVSGLGAGSTLAVTVEEIRTVGPGAIGFALTRLPGEPWGGVLRESAREGVFREVEVRDGRVWLSADTPVPTRPMVGWIGLILTEYRADPWEHGGNLDTTALTEGATLYLHDATGAGRFLLGDVHAAMGEGEVSGMGVEIAAEVRIRVDVLPETLPHRPLITDGRVVSHLCSRFLERDAYAQCIADAAAHLAYSQAITLEEANAWLGVIGDLRVSTVVSHSPTYRMEVPQGLLAEPTSLLRNAVRPELPHGRRPDH